ncbi:MAG: HAMP domain-containing protein [Sphingopyxis sp.]|uniref:HAMP domain-containing protein n=1 Tax=Sphingopyxis sp. TaxID=1908224 RepID=UPI002ABC4096|nr:HAMP domain-containing protein [Sphingopyxis sp.]MDZ3832704.1 HAMP domain-containing protein [Sphingopyxis sp.]
MRPERKLGIRALLLRVFLPIVVAVATLFATLVYLRLDATIIRQFDDRLITTSALVGALVDPEDHDWLIETAAAGGDLTAAEADIRYRRNVEPMRRIRAQLGLTYIYTQVITSPSEVRYILDGTEGPEHTNLGAPDTLPPDTMAGLHDVQAQAHTYVSPVEYQEQWGLLKAGAAPVYGADGAIRGTAGADVNVSVLRVATQNALYLSAMAGLASLLACLLVTLRIMRHVARPIQKLTQDALRIAAGDHHDPATIDSPAEVKRLQRALAGLNDHVTADLRAAEARADRHRSAATERWFLGRHAPGRAPVVLADRPDLLLLWLPLTDDSLPVALAHRAMMLLGDRIAICPELAEQVEHLADRDHGALLRFDRQARRLSQSGPAPIDLESESGPLHLVPGRAILLATDVSDLRYRNMPIPLTKGGKR